jgi:hypothetical protein
VDVRVFEFGAAGEGAAAKVALEIANQLVRPTAAARCLPKE